MLVKRLAFLFVASALLACGGGGDGGTTNPPPPPPPPPPPQTLGSITTNVSSVNLAAGSTQAITVSALDTQGNAISNPGSPTFTVPGAGAAVAEVDVGGVVLGLGAGTTTVTASLTLGGVTRTAAVGVTVTGVLPAVANVSTSLGDAFTPNKVAIGRGGSVIWTFSATAHNVNFTGAGAPSNISDRFNTTESRTFSTAGNFAYNCLIHAGMSGTIIVR